MYLKDVIISSTNAIKIIKYFVKKYKSQRIKITPPPPPQWLKVNLCELCLSM